ncbi:MAG: CoA ester lyase [Verrucomicrobiota bacterium]|jgi:citrate lyase subunit beta / citryl-CoA lyase
MQALSANEVSSRSLVVRSLLFAPANRRDLILKFPRIGADCSVIDLEDGTPLASKEAAREGLAELVREVRRTGWAGTLAVRVNTSGSEQFSADIVAAVRSGVDAIVVPKLERASDLDPVVAACGRDGKQAIIGGIETAAGVLAAAEICRSTSHLRAVFFGAEDLSADIGARRTEAGYEVHAARSMVLLAAKAARLLAIDQAVVDIRDDDLFLRDAAKGRDMGYDGKTCLTPGQVKLAHRAFSPSLEERDFSARLVAAYVAASSRAQGTFEFEGKMIDTPLLKRAQAILAMPCHIHP